MVERASDGDGLGTGRNDGDTGGAGDHIDAACVGASRQGHDCGEDAAWQIRVTDGNTGAAKVEWGLFCGGVGSQARSANTLEFVTEQDMVIRIIIIGPNPVLKGRATHRVAPGARPNCGDLPTGIVKTEIGPA